MSFAAQVLSIYSQKSGQVLAIKKIIKWRAQHEMKWKQLSETFSFSAGISRGGVSTGVEAPRSRLDLMVGHSTGYANICTTLIFWITFATWWIAGRRRRNSNSNWITRSKFNLAVGKQNVRRQLKFLISHEHNCTKVA